MNLTQKIYDNGKIKMNYGVYTPENYGHNDGINYAYEHTDLIEWLILQRRTDFDKVSEFCSHLF